MSRIIELLNEALPLSVQHGKMTVPKATSEQFLSLRRKPGDYAFVIVGAEAGMLRMTRVPFPGWLTISTLPP